MIASNIYEVYVIQFLPQMSGQNYKQSNVCFITGHLKLVIRSLNRSHNQRSFTDYRVRVGVIVSLLLTKTEQIASIYMY